jgi:uncharacterized membrane protein
VPALISEYVPQVFADYESARRVRVAWLAWGAVLVLASLVVGVVVLAPVLRAHGEIALSQVIYAVFHFACHQMPERSFQIEGFPLAICARCTGLYVGGLLGVLAYPFVRALTHTDAPDRMWLILSVVPTTVDFALGFFGIWENTHWSRFLTALLAGAATSFYVVPGMVGVSLARFRRPEGQSPAGI